MQNGPTTVESYMEDSQTIENVVIIVIQLLGIYPKYTKQFKRKPAWLCLLKHYLQ